MKLYRLALAAWFILWGLFAISNFKLEMSNVILGCLAIAGGVLWILDR